MSPIIVNRPDAAIACRWTARQLSPEDIEYLENLPLTIVREEFTLVHGSPREPLWEYIISKSIALRNFAFFKSPFCLVGHSHAPAVFKADDDEDLGEKISTLFSDHELLAKMRVQCRTKAEEHFDLAKSALKIETIINDTIQNRAKRNAP